MMSKPLQLTLEISMSSVPAFHVRTSVWPDFKKELPKKQDQVFSLKSSESYAWYDQNSLSWKTWQRSLITDWTSYSGSFQKQGMMRNGQLYRAKIWEAVIEDSVGGALPTPTAREWKDGSWNSVKNCKFHHTLGRHIHLAVRSLPTPTTMDYLPQRSVESMKKQSTEHRKGRTQLANLREAVNPKAVNLFNQLQTLPTPTAHEHKATGQKNTSQSGQMLSSIARRGELSEETGADMFLNPAFVEEMMGYEVGWTDLNH